MNARYYLLCMFVFCVGAVFGSVTKKNRQPVNDPQNLIANKSEYIRIIEPHTDINGRDIKQIKLNIVHVYKAWDHQSYVEAGSAPTGDDIWTIRVGQTLYYARKD